LGGKGDSHQLRFVGIDSGGFGIEAKTRLFFEFLEQLLSLFRRIDEVVGVLGIFQVLFRHRMLGRGGATFFLGE